MNVRKSVDYSAMFSALDTLMAAQLSQMELYCEIGRIICGRSEKGAAVAAAGYLQETYPNTNGFSPRNLRRMRDFYCMYQDDPRQMELAMRTGWTQNVVILEADLSAEERAWYLQASVHFAWSKSELTRQIDAGAHLVVSIDSDESLCYTATQEDHNDLDELSGTQHGGEGKSASSTCPPQTFQAWDLLYRHGSSSVQKQRPRQRRTAGLNGFCKPATYVPHLRWELWGEDAPPDGLYRPPKRCSRPMLHRQFQHNQMGCGGKLPRAP